MAAAANAFAAVRPAGAPSPGLTSRDGEDPSAVGVYGRGPTTVMVLPLRGQVLGPLRARLRESAGFSETEFGTLAPVGPVGLLLTPRISRPELRCCSPARSRPSTCSGPPPSC